MIFFIRRREIGKYTLPYLDLSEQPLFCRIAYRFCRGAARLKFGGWLTEEELRRNRRQAGIRRQLRHSLIDKKARSVAFRARRLCFLAVFDLDDIERW